MGYTHYWRDLPKEIPESVWQELLVSIRRIIELAEDVPLANGAGDEGTEPELTDELISFNGVGDDSYETFWVSRRETAREREYDGRKFGFCKTAHRPYDVVVTACILALKHHVTAVYISSDGVGADYADPGIKAGKDLFHRAVPVLAPPDFAR